MDNDNKNALILALMVALKVIKKYLGLFILLFILVFLLVLPTFLELIAYPLYKLFGVDSYILFRETFGSLWFLRTTLWFVYSFIIPILYCLVYKLFKKIPFYLSILKPFYYFSLGISSVIIGISLYFNYYNTIFSIPVLYGILSIIIGFIRKKNVGKI